MNQMSTIGEEGTERCAELAGRRQRLAAGRAKDELPGIGVDQEDAGGLGGGAEPIPAPF